MEFSKEKEEKCQWIKIIPFEVINASGAPAYALRLEEEGKVKYHLYSETLLEKQANLTCQRLILTHMHEDVWPIIKELKLEWAEDGK